MPAPIHLQLARQIVDTLKSICEHDINYIDTQGRICASTDEARIDDYHEGGAEAARTGEIITIEEDDPEKGVRRGINMPIRYRGDTVAVIGITGEPEEVRKYAFLAQRITLLLLREHEMDVKNHNLQSQIHHVVISLVNQETLNQDFLQEVLKRCGIDSVSGTWQAAVIQLNERYHLSNLAMIESRLYQTFEQIEECLYTYNYPNEYILIGKKELKGLDYLADKYEEILKIGVGTKGKLSGVYRSFHSARLALGSMPAGKNLQYFEDLDLELLLAGVSRHTADMYLQKCLAPLDEADRELLLVYFATEMSLKRTAELLFLHKNTLQYRLNRIRERCGYDPRVFRDAVVLYCALRLEQVVG